MNQITLTPAGKRVLSAKPGFSQSEVMLDSVHKNAVDFLISKFQYSFIYSFHSHLSDALNFKVIFGVYEELARQGVERRSAGRCLPSEQLILVNLSKFDSEWYHYNITPDARMSAVLVHEFTHGLNSLGNIGALIRHLADKYLDERLLENRLLLAIRGRKDSFSSGVADRFSFVAAIDEAFSWILESAFLAHKYVESHPRTDWIDRNCPSEALVWFKAMDRKGLGSLHYFEPTNEETYRPEKYVARLNDLKQKY